MKFLKLKLCWVAIIFASLGMTTAQAGVLDFTTVALDEVIDGSGGLDTTDNLYTFTNGFQTVDARGWSDTEGEKLYIDNISQPPAGLGVNDQSGGDEEELEVGEYITLTFDTFVNLTGMTLVDSDHGTSFSNLPTLNIYVTNESDSSSLSDISTLTAVVSGLAASAILDLSSYSLIGQTFYIAVASGGSNPLDGFYISSVTVPEPGTLVLLGLGFLMLGFSKYTSTRRRG